MSRFANHLQTHGLDLRRSRFETLQLNLGRKCNQACRHCHVDAAPWRTELPGRGHAIADEAYSPDLLAWLVAQRRDGVRARR